MDKNSKPLSLVMRSVIAQLDDALAKVVSNKGAPGVDRQSVHEVKEAWRTIRPGLAEALADGSYQPGLIRRAWIPKDKGKKRALGIPNVVDRVVQDAFRRVLEPKCERHFHPNSHGFRPHRSCHGAIRQARDFVADGYGWVVDLDLETFFDRVHHQRLMARLAQIEPDRQLLVFVGRMLRAKVLMPNGVVVSSTEGVPQGGPLSALLSNVVLNELDWELEGRGHKFVRYADDVNIYVRSERAGQRVMQSVSAWIDRRLRLKVNLDKSAVGRPRDRHFVGFTLEPSENEDGEVHIGLSERSRRRLERRIVELTPRNRGQGLDVLVERLNSYLTGWFSFFELISPREKSYLEQIDGHTRRRLRAAQLRQWKRKRSQKRKLMTEYGASSTMAGWIVYGGRARIWRMSIRANRAMSNDAIRRKLGLVGLVTLLERRNPPGVKARQLSLIGVG